MELKQIGGLVFLLFVIGLIGFALVRGLVWDRIKGKKQSDSSKPKEK